MLGNHQPNQLPFLVKEGLLFSIPEYFRASADNCSFLLLFGFKVVSFDCTIYESSFPSFTTLSSHPTHLLFRGQMYPICLLGSIHMFLKLMVLLRFLCRLSLSVHTGASYAVTTMHYHHTGILRTMSI